MYKEQLRREYNSSKRAVITLSILTAVAVVFVIFTVFGYITGLIEIGIQANEGILSDGEIARMIGKAVTTFILSLILEILAICAFVPFIVINAIKMGKRRRKLSLPDVEVI